MTFHIIIRVKLVVFVMFMNYFFYFFKIIPFRKNNWTVFSSHELIFFKYTYNKRDIVICDLKICQ